MSQPTVVAFLQNQWFPARHLATIELAYRLHGPTPEDRADLNARYLFFRCLTGRRLRAAFGDELCDRIVWENASPRIATEASGAFPPDLGHIRSVIGHFRPAAILTFGVPATKGVWAAMGDGDQTPVFTGPHPAARGACVAESLRGVGAALLRLCPASSQP